MLDARHIDPTAAQCHVGAGDEVNIFAALVELGRGRIAQAVGDLCRFRIRQRVDEDAVLVIGELFTVGKPAAIRRPARAKP